MKATKIIAVICCLQLVFPFCVNGMSLSLPADEPSMQKSDTANVPQSASGKKVILGTHNSATSGATVWWQRPFEWLLDITSRCQNKSIEEQLEGGVRLFNLQVCRYNEEWHISHGLCIYKEKLFDILDQLKQYKGIVIQLYLDDNFFVGQDEEEFIKLVEEVKKNYCSPDFIMHMAWIEGTDKYPHKTEQKLSIEEHYWTKSWADKFAGSWVEKLPLPKSHAKKYNNAYIENCKNEYLMLDFFE